jgi:hypothetical protein
MIFAGRAQLHNASFVKTYSADLTDFTVWYAGPNSHLLSNNSFTFQDNIIMVSIISENVCSFFVMTFIFGVVCILSGYKLPKMNIA